jgi:hypothetical protein
VKKWRDHVRLEKKIPVRRLYIIGTTDATNFIGKSALVFRMAEMLDDGIAEHDLERLIGKGQGARITQDPFEPATLRTLHSEIQDGHARRERHERPIELAPTDIEHGRFRLHTKVAIKNAQAPPAKTAKELEERFDIHFCFVW